MTFNFNKESFCPEAWSQLEINMAGDYSICCLANYDSDFGMAVDANGKQMNVLTHSFEEALNSETHKQHRLQMSRNEKPQRCRNCYDSEESTKGFANQTQGRSRRHRIIWGISHTVAEYTKIGNVEQVTKEDGTATSKIVNLHIRFGNLCNLRCVMCSPQHSSLWYDDWLALGRYGGATWYKLGNKKFNIEKDEHGRNRLGFEKWWETDIWWERFQGIIPQLKFLYFTGGEPFLVPALDKCLDMMIEAGVAHKIALRFDTNLTVINEKILNKLKKFKKIILSVSADETGDRYEFIRNPGNYDKFVSNLKTIVERRIPVESITSCIGMATIYAVPRVNALATEHGIKGEFRFLEGPDWLDLRHLPKSAKDEIIAEYEKLNASETNQHHIKWNTAVIRLMQKYNDESFTNYAMVEEFVRCMNILDTQRNTNWRATLPDVYDLLTRHCKDTPGLVL